MSSYRHLRIWPAVVLLAGMILLRYLPGLIEDGPSALWMAPAFGPLLCGVGLLLWWLIASRATKRERWIGFVGVLLAIGISQLLVHHSMRGPGTTMLTVPMATAAFALGALLGGRQQRFARTSRALALSFIAASFSLLLRSEGMWGDFSNQYVWRWRTATEDTLAERTQAGTQRQELDEALFQGLANPDWPGFRGADRSGRQSGSRPATDWKAYPPKLLWKVPMGLGWSSFAVAGPLLFTQDQRGDLETVVCLHADTGEELWTHAIESRFDEPLGGAGPRATPTLHEGSLYVMGAEGWLLRLDARTGEMRWKQDLREAAQMKPPMWGFASSPLIVNETVIVHAGGSGDLGVLAFDRGTGELQWSVPSGAHSYGAPQPCQILGQNLVAMASDRGLDLLDPATGSARLNYSWPHKGYRCLQPLPVGDNGIVILTGLGNGTRRIRVTDTAGDRFEAEEVWTSRRLKPDFNDAVLYQGNLYGFDVSMFTCIDVETGERQWKGGRYGKGQVLLLADAGLLLVTSERGEVHLIKATPDAHEELAQFSAFSGKTWNHPVVIKDRLYVRNGEEAACYVLTQVTADFD